MSKLQFEKKTLSLDKLVFSTKYQAREEISKEALEDYIRLVKEAVAKGADIPFPALKAVKRGNETIVFSGFTRGRSLKANDVKSFEVEVAEVPAEFTDTEIFQLAIDANLEHGVRFTNADKKHNLERLLKDKAMAELSNVQLAEKIGASEFFVRTHRPATASPETRTAVNKKTGKKTKVKTGRIGKKGGKAAKPTKKKGKGKSVDKESAALDEALGKDEGKLSDDAERALNRIANLLEGQLGFTSKGIREGVEKGTLKVSGKDLKDWAGTSDARVIKAAPLIVNLGWSPKQAFSHLDKEVNSSTRVEHLVNSAISGGGVVRSPNDSSKFGEKITDNENFKVVVWDARKFKVTVEEV